MASSAGAENNGHVIQSLPFGSGPSRTVRLIAFPFLFSPRVGLLSFVFVSGLRVAFEFVPRLEFAGIPWFPGRDESESRR